MAPQHGKCYDQDMCSPIGGATVRGTWRSFVFAGAGLAGCSYQQSLSPHLSPRERAGAMFREKIY